MLMSGSHAGPFIRQELKIVHVLSVDEYLVLSDNSTVAIATNKMSPVGSNSDNGGA